MLKGKSSDWMDQVAKDSRTQRIFPAAGLTPLRIVHALSQLGIKAVKVYFPLPANGTTQESEKKDLEKLALRMIECYVQARYPVILGVDVKEWANKEASDGHAVTIVGLRKRSIQNRQEQLIVHDPAKQPFVERSTVFCFRAAWVCDKNRPGIVLIMPAESTVTRSLASCIQSMLRTNRGLFSILLRGQSPFHPQSEFECQFSLEYRKDIHTFVWPVPLGSSDRENLDRHFALTRNRYWCIAGYQNGELRVAWFFPTDENDDQDWELQLFRNNQEQFSLRRRGNSSHIHLELPKDLESSLNRLRQGT
jgi:hypothetical protein